MRLIDADALKENMVKICKEVGKAMGITMPVLAFTRSIDNAPTITPEKALMDKLKGRPQGKTNADLFKQTFGMYATEIWSMNESQFLEWLNEEVTYENSIVDNSSM